MRSDAKRTPILAAYLHPRDPRCISTPTRSSLHIYTHAHRYPRPGTTAVPLIPASPPSERGGTGHTSRHHRRPSDPGITAEASGATCTRERVRGTGHTEASEGSRTHGSE